MHKLETEQATHDAFAIHRACRAWRKERISLRPAGSLIAFFGAGVGGERGIAVLNVGVIRTRRETKNNIGTAARLVTKRFQRAGSFFRGFRVCVRVRHRV